MKQFPKHINAEQFLSEKELMKRNEQCENELCYHREQITKLLSDKKKILMRLMMFMTSTDIFMTETQLLHMSQIINILRHLIKWNIFVGQL